MRLSLVFVLVAAAMPAYAQSAGTPNPIIVQENAFWKAYVEADTTSLSKLFSPDFINVEEQLMSRSQVLAFVRAFHEHCTLAAVEIINPKVTFLSPDIATLVYHATESPTCGKRTMSGDTNITTVWVRRNGQWQMHLHTEYATAPRLAVQGP
jgi:uncharacterized protein (TIGR02246 family)